MDIQNNVQIERKKTREDDKGMGRAGQRGKQRRIIRAAA